MVSNQVCTTACTSSGWSATKVESKTRWSGIAPGKSFDVAIALLPGRSSAVVVNGANAPTASTWPALNAAAASAVGSALMVTSSPVRPAFLQREQQQEVVDRALLDGDRLALEVGHGVDALGRR